jgi:glycosyltransferase involved in cell wall biosynthesis
MNKPTIYLTTVVHNDLSKTKELLKCVQAQSYKNYKIFITNDNSSDGTSKYLLGIRSLVCLNSQNDLWWAG